MKRKKKEKNITITSFIYYIATVVLATAVNFIRDENPTAPSMYNAMDYCKS